MKVPIINIVVEYFGFLMKKVEKMIDIPMQLEYTNHIVNDNHSQNE